MRFLRYLLLLLLLLGLGPAGCTKRRPAGEFQPFGVGKPVDGYLIVVVDVSGSFQAQLARDSKVVAHLQRVVQSFFEAGAGTERNDRVLVAYIAGDPLPILFEGSPRQFQESFPSADALRKALFARANPGGSRVFDSISDAVEQALRCDGVVPGKSRLSLLILSDMEDNISNSQTAARFQRVLGEYAKAGGGLGLHWLPQNHVQPWRDYLTRAGFSAKQMRVTADFQPEVPLPNF